MQPWMNEAMNGAGVASPPSDPARFTVRFYRKCHEDVKCRQLVELYGIYYRALDPQCKTGYVDRGIPCRRGFIAVRTCSHLKYASFSIPLLIFDLFRSCIAVYSYPSIHMVSFRRIYAKDYIPKPPATVDHIRHRLRHAVMKVFKCSASTEFFLWSLITKTFNWKYNDMSPQASLSLSLMDVTDSKPIVDMVKLLMPMAS